MSIRLRLETFVRGDFHKEKDNLSKLEQPRGYSNFALAISAAIPSMRGERFPSRSAKVDISAAVDRSSRESLHKPFAANL